MWSKRAVYSYSIQHGQLSAANAVVAAKISNSSSDSEFLLTPILLPYETVSGFTSAATVPSMHRR
ncbi:MAG: hypothetical protein ACLR2E_05885 [Lachnospiraceae bacterium]